MGDDDWELFVPVKGEMYPNHYQVKLHDNSVWQDGGSPGLRIKSPTCYAYRKPKQKENKMPDRTPQQALKDAIDSGAVDAWINGEDTHCSVEPGNPSSWVFLQDPDAFHNPLLFHRVRPPEPTKINWRPVVTGKEPKGWVLCTWKDTSNYVALCRRVPQEDPHDQDWEDAEGTYYDPPTHWAPMCNLPE